MATTTKSPSDAAGQRIRDNALADTDFRPVTGDRISINFEDAS